MAWGGREKKARVREGMIFPLSLPRGAAGGVRGQAHAPRQVGRLLAAPVSHLLLFLPFSLSSFSSRRRSVPFFFLASLVGWKTTGFGRCGGGFYEVSTWTLAAWLGIDMGGFSLLGFGELFLLPPLFSHSLSFWSGFCWSAGSAIVHFSLFLLFSSPFSRFLLLPVQRLLFFSSSLTQLGFFRFVIYPTLFRLDSTFFCLFLGLSLFWGGGGRGAGARDGWNGSSVASGIRGGRHWLVWDGFA